MDASDASDFAAELIEANTELANYLIAALIAGNHWPDRTLTPAQEEALGTRLIRLGVTLRRRARDRRSGTQPPGDLDSP